MLVTKSWCSLRKNSEGDFWKHQKYPRYIGRFYRDCPLRGTLVLVVPPTINLANPLNLAASTGLLSMTYTNTPWNSYFRDQKLMVGFDEEGPFGDQKAYFQGADSVSFREGYDSFWLQKLTPLLLTRCMSHTHFAQA